MSQVKNTKGCQNEDEGCLLQIFNRIKPISIENISVIFTLQRNTTGLAERQKRFNRVNHTIKKIFSKKNGNVNVSDVSFHRSMVFMVFLVKLHEK